MEEESHKLLQWRSMKLFLSLDVSELKLDLKKLKVNLSKGKNFDFQWLPE